jgi:hypothetical protein
MARLFWLVLMLACAAALAAGVSWITASVAVNSLLGSPPPQMGNQSSSFLWDGMPQLPDHPRVWRFAFGPTQIPGAPSVQIYVTPLGRIVETEPGNLAALLKAFRPL